MLRLRVHEIAIENLRTLRDVRLRTEGLTVLIGENGSGKSSILEAIELLRRVGESTFDRDFQDVHGGAGLLLRAGAQRLALEVTLTDRLPRHGGDVDAEQVRYRVEVRGERSGRYDIDREIFESRRADSRVIFERSDTKVTRTSSDGVTRFEAPHRQLLTHPDVLRHESVFDLREALARMEVHVGFEVTPHWVARAHRRETALRDRSQINREVRLSVLGTNLAAAYSTLKNEHPHNKRWGEVLDWIRLGLGYHIEDVLIQAAGAGFIELSIKQHGLDAPIRSAALSNGQLAWLAFVAMAYLGLVDGRPLLAFDEPELHLHPALLVRAAELLELVSQEHPVIVATHSRRILDALGESAADAAVLCEYFQKQGETHLHRFDRAALRDWLQEYDGLGEILDAGYERHVLRPPETQPQQRPGDPDDGRSK